MMIVARYECSHCHQGGELTREELTQPDFGESSVLDLIHGLPAYARSLSCTSAELDYAWPVPVRYPERLTFQELHQWALTAERLNNDAPWHTVVRWADFLLRDWTPEELEQANPAEAYIGTFSTLRQLSEAIVPELAELPEEFGPYLNFAELCEDMAQDYVILKVPEGYAVFTY